MTNSTEENLITEVISQLVGEDAVKVALVLRRHSEVTDDMISEETEMSLKEVRRALYKLNEKYLARYRRTRDSETGYFVYHWSILEPHLAELIFRRRKMTIRLMKQRLDFEQRNLLYSCTKTECVPVAFEDAFEQGFICKDCSEPLEQRDNATLIQLLQARISDLDKILQN